MGKEIVNQVKEAQKVPYGINPRGNTPRYILIKLSKIKYKQKIVKAARERAGELKVRRQRVVKNDLLLGEVIHLLLGGEVIT